MSAITAVANNSGQLLLCKHEEEERVTTHRQVNGIFTPHNNVYQYAKIRASSPRSEYQETVVKVVGAMLQAGNA